jgi:hypothetical protein
VGLELGGPILIDQQVNEGAAVRCDEMIGHDDAGYRGGGA